MQSFDAGQASRVLLKLALSHAYCVISWRVTLLIQDSRRSLSNFHVQVVIKPPIRHLPLRYQQSPCFPSSGRLDTRMFTLRLLLRFVAPENYYVGEGG